MKKKGNLVKRLFIYVFSLFMLTIYTTGCVSYDEDIDDIYNQLEKLQSQIDDIKKQIAEGNYVVSVTNLGNGIRITFNRGEPVDIINGTNGQNGAPGTQWAIGVTDSMWYKDGVKQPYRAIGETGKQGESAPSPKIIYQESDAKYYWVVFEWDDATNDFLPDTLKTMPVYNYDTYVVDKGFNYELNVWVKDSPTATTGEYKIIPLPKNYNPSDPYFLEFLGYYKHYNILTPDKPISMTTITDDITYYYWYISKIRNATDGGDTPRWVGRKTVEPKYVLTTLEKDSAVAIIRTNLSKASWKLTLKDSQGGLLPISFGNPVRHEGAFTKASGSDSIYILQMDGTDKKYASAIAYRDTFKTANNLGVVYSLTDTVTGINSGYKAFITLYEGGYSMGEVNLSTIDGQQADTNNEYLVRQNEDIKIGFSNSTYLYDHSIEAVDLTQAVDNFGFTVNKQKGTFKVKIPETPPVETTFKIIVYKLNYNGDFYKDTVTIKPIALP
jgi:hypothetical protein